MWFSATARTRSLHLAGRRRRRVGSRSHQREFAVGEQLQGAHVGIRICSQLRGRPTPAVRPPSTGITAPFTYPASGVVRNAATAAIFVGRREAPGRDPRLDRRAVGGERRHHLGIHKAGRDVVHRDAAPRALDRQRADIGEECRLAGAVGGVALAGDLADHRADGDDAAGSAPAASAAPRRARCGRRRSSSPAWPARRRPGPSSRPARRRWCRRPAPSRPRPARLPVPRRSARPRRGRRGRAHARSRIGCAARSASRSPGSVR